ncbi:MAG: hypothetical protein OEM26_05995, partial [Saprospiraceae bacterium]|nr:hypothetical protein [Saprospiraceae bacterium]
QIDFEGKTPNTPFVVASDLSNPEGLAWDQDGSLVVVETGTNRLTRIDLSTGDKTTIVDNLEISGPGPEGFPPTYGFDGVAISPSGDIYVTGGAVNVIYRITQN